MNCILNFMYTRCVIAQFIWRTRKKATVEPCPLWGDLWWSLCGPQKKLGEPTLLGLPLGRKPREVTEVAAGRRLVFSELRGVLQQVLVCSVHTLYTSHLPQGGRRMETSSLCERRDGVSEAYDTKPLSPELQSFNLPGVGFWVHDLYNKNAKKECVCWSSTVTSDSWKCFRGKGSTYKQQMTSLLPYVGNGHAPYCSRQILSPWTCWGFWILFYLFYF